MANNENVNRIWEYLKLIFEEANESQNKCFVEISAKHSATLTEQNGVRSSEILPIIELEWNMKDISKVAILAKNAGIQVHHITSDDASDVMVDRDEKFIFTNVTD